MSRPSDTLRPGDPAPPFTLPDQKGRPRTSEELLSGGALLMAFHRGTW